MRSAATGLFALCAFVAACSSPERDRVRATSRGRYDAAGKLTEVTYDRDKNGKVDTWVQIQEGRPVSAVLDTNENGVIDRWEFYDAAGRLTKAGESRADTGKSLAPAPTNATASAPEAGTVPAVPIVTTEVLAKVGKPDSIDNSKSNTPRWIYKKKTFDPDNQSLFDDETILIFQKDPASGKFKVTQVIFG